MRRRRLQKALLDVALEHELDLACDIAYYGPSDYPMAARLLRALAGTVPGFEFNSLRRWLSLPGQFEQLMGAATSITPIQETGRASQRRGSALGCAQVAEPKSSAEFGRSRPRSRGAG